MAKRDNRAWLKPVMRSVRPIYREVIAMSLFVNTLALATPVFVLQVYDRVVFHAGLSTLKALVIGMLLVVMFDFLLRQSRARMLQKAALRFDVAVGRALFARLMRLPLFDLEKRPAVFWHALFRDLEAVRNTLSGPPALLIVDLPFATLFVVLVFIIAPPVAWVLLIVVPLYILIAYGSGRSLQAASGEERQSGFARERLIGEMVAGRATVKALALQDWLRPKWESAHAESILRALDRGSKSDGFTNMALALMVLTTVTITGFGALSIVEHQMTIGSLIATNILVGRIGGPFNQLVSSWRNYTMYRQAIARLGEVFSLAEESERTEVELPRPRGEISLDNLSFHYGDAEALAIDSIKAQIRPPGLLGIVGSNGSGKTTLLKLMQGLYAPSAGRVLLDGGDIAQFSRRQLARWIGYVPQECVLFAGRIRDNLVAGRPEASDEDIVRAATLAGLHERVVDLPDGYGTEVGEGGMRLPGGLRQRVAIARAMVGDPPVLLFDEPSSNLDREGEDELKRNLAGLAKDHMVVVVTHSPVLLTACSMIIVLERGRLVRAGPPAEVMPDLLTPPPPAPVRLNRGA